MADSRTARPSVDPRKAAATSRGKRRRSLLRALLLTIAIIGLFIVLAGGWAWWAFHASPAFYAEVKDIDTTRAAAEGDELERRVLEARNVARRPGAWSMTLTEDQLNSWFAINLPKEFPDALPREVSEPRVSIESDRVLMGCRYREGSIDTILSLDVRLYLTDEPRVVAAQLRSVRAGRLPIPPTKILEPLAAATRRGNSPVRWIQEGGDPVALWTMPEKMPELGNRKVVLEKIELSDGKVVLSGRSE
ncbi:MAG: hypothetical protein U1A77_19845 [Pirellulales bacterium]